MQECASEIRKALDDYDFGLEDRFCDAQDLKLALSNMRIPEPVLRFFGHLFNFNPATYAKAAETVMADNTIDLTDDLDDDETGQDKPSDSALSLSNAAGRCSHFFK